VGILVLRQPVKHIYNGKYMCVVVRLEEKLIATAYITDRIKEGEIVWKKN
jgi:hypothetical protein